MIPRVYDSGSSKVRLAAESPTVAGSDLHRTKPTFNEETGLNERVVEAYAVTDEWLDLYGHDVRVEFAGFLRPQVKFDSADALKDELRATSRRPGN